MKTIFEEFGGTIVYVIAGGGVLGIFGYILSLAI
jgi:hypothetical protein